jgi:hypothetical protein
MRETAETIKHYHVFLSSPGDMEQEREAVRDVFNSLNQAIAKPFGIQFDVIDWENCTNIGYQNVQDLITSQTLKRFRNSLVLVIGLMGQRFGTPTGEFESGTQAEFEWAAAHKKQYGHPEIKWFFRRVDHLVVPAENDRLARDAFKQWRKVKRFRKDYQGYYKEYTNAEGFPDVLREDLLRWFASWVIGKRAIKVRGSSAKATNPFEVPGFLDNRLSRTLRIVTALEDMLRASSQNDQPCVRICAVMSSLAITRQNSWATAGDEEYLQLIERERDLIEQLFERKVSIKVLLTWNVKEMLEWQKRTREDVITRLNRLKTFCERTLKDDERVKHATLVHIAVRERNILILGNKYVFEGRKLGTEPGFEATEVITDKRRVTQQIEMFDILFRNAVDNECQGVKCPDKSDLNRRLLVGLIDRIDQDMKELKATSDGT